MKWDRWKKAPGIKHWPIPSPGKHNRTRHRVTGYRRPHAAVLTAWLAPGLFEVYGFNSEGAPAQIYMRQLKQSRVKAPRPLVRREMLAALQPLRQWSAIRWTHFRGLHPSPTQSLHTISLCGSLGMAKLSLCSPRIWLCLFCHLSSGWLMTVLYRDTADLRSDSCTPFSHALLVP